MYSIDSQSNELTSEVEIYILVYYNILKGKKGCPSKKKKADFKFSLSPYIIISPRGIKKQKNSFENTVALGWRRLPRKRGIVGSNPRRCNNDPLLRRGSCESLLGNLNH